MEKETETRGDNSNQVYQQIFKYDRFGNRYLKAADNPSNQNPLYPTPIEDNNIDRTTNRLASNTNTLYDDAGNITTDGKYRNLKYFYDANGRMYKTSQTNDTNQANTVYDAGGNKVATKVNDVWRFLIYDIGGKLIAEYGGTDSTDEGGVKFIHQDLQDSTRLLTNLTGTVLSRIDYQAFGEEIPQTIGQRTAQGYGISDSIRQRYGLTNRDEATGLDDTWFRKLEQRGGRWTSPDPYNGSMSLGNPQSFNRYSYVENQPTNYVDPSGLFAEGPGAGCSRGYLTRVWYGNDNNGWTLVSERFTCYDSNSGGFSFGGGSSGNQGVVFEDKLPFNNCSEFIDWFVKSLNHSINKYKGQFLSDVSNWIGEGLMKVAYFGYDSHINNGFSGFKSELTSAGAGTEAGAQGAGVYGHLLFHSGAYLRDFGSVASTVADWYDKGQKYFGHKQGASEVAGNQAGTDIGKFAYEYMQGKINESDLRKKMKDRICE